MAMEGLALALVPPDDSDFVFVSPIDEHCPIGGGGGGGGGKGGVFATGKKASFGSVGGAGAGAGTASRQQRIREIRDSIERLHGRVNYAPTTPTNSRVASAVAQLRGMRQNLEGGGQSQKTDGWSTAVEAGVVYGASPSKRVSGLDWKSTVGRKLTFSEMLIASHQHDDDTLFRIYVPRGARGSDDGETVVLPAATFTVHAADRYVDLIMHR
jgi:hypothetical protein